MRGREGKVHNNRKPGKWGLVQRLQIAVVVIAFAVGTFIVEAQTQVTGVFFNEGWESGSKAGSFNSNGFGDLIGAPQFLVQNAVRAGGQWALQHRLTAGLDGDSVNYATQHFGDAPSGPVLSSGAGQHFYDLYVQYKIYYSPGFRFDTNYKQFEIGTQDDLNQTSTCCNPWVANYLTLLVAPGGGLLGETNNKGQATPQWIGWQANQNGYTSSNRFILQSGRWYSIEVRRRLNDAGTANGILQMWVDGLLIMDHRNVNYRVQRNGAYGANFTYGTNWVMISDYALQGVSQNQSIYYDDVKLSTTYIGTSGGGTAPSPPTNLRIVS
jgi:hypothetical protein